MEFHFKACGGWNGNKIKIYCILRTTTKNPRINICSLYKYSWYAVVPEGDQISLKFLPSFSLKASEGLISKSQSTVLVESKT